MLQEAWEKSTIAKFTGVVGRPRGTNIDILLKVHDNKPPKDLPQYMSVNVSLDAEPSVKGYEVVIGRS